MICLRDESAVLLCALLDTNHLNGCRQPGIRYELNCTICKVTLDGCSMNITLKIRMHRCSFIRILLHSDRFFKLASTYLTGAHRFEECLFRNTNRSYPASDEPSLIFRVYPEIVHNGKFHLSTPIPVQFPCLGQSETHSSCPGTGNLGQMDGQTKCMPIASASIIYQPSTEPGALQSPHSHCVSGRNSRPIPPSLAASAPLRCDVRYSDRLNPLF